MTLAFAAGEYVGTTLAPFVGMELENPITSELRPRSKAHAELSIHGDVCPGFEPVRVAFIENLTRRGELGGACCIYRHGEKVVDVWGGLRDRASGAPWQDDELVDADVVRDLDRLAGIMARQRPEWETGERQACHAISLGFYESEIVRRVDPAHRSLGQFFSDEIAKPLGIDFFIGLPDTVPDTRVAPLEPPSFWQRMRGMPLPLVLSAMNRHSVVYRSIVANPGTQFYLDPVRVVARDLEVPSGGGVGSARSLAKAYGVFASGGRELGLRQETLAALAAPATPSRHGFFDEFFRGEVPFSLGFMKPSDAFPFGHPGAFGAPGAGGAMAYADPETGIGYGYVTSRMGVHLRGDPRDLALRAAIPGA